MWLKVRRQQSPISALMITGKNIQSLLYHDPAPGAVERTFEDFQTDYGVGPTGINLYYGITDERVEEFEKGQLLRDSHKFVLELVRQRAAKVPQMVLNVSLLPLEQVEPFHQVVKDESLAMIRAFAGHLAAFQAEIAGLNSHLDIYIRYASEMNDPGTEKQPYGFKGEKPQGVPLERQIEEFKSTFVTVRQQFADFPAIKFCFSPAIRANLGARYTRLPRYYPGDSVVDAFSCTFYVGRPGDLDGACKTLRAYCLHRLGSGKPFGIDELGGKNPDGPRNEVLRPIFEYIDGLESENVHFAWASIFLETYWGKPKADLSFLSERFPAR
jgi:hypothetical protein